MVEQRREVGIGALVVDDEAGIDRHRIPARAHEHGIAVPAGSRRALVDGDVVTLGEQPGRRHPRDSGPDDGDPEPDRGNHAVHPCPFQPRAPGPFCKTDQCTSYAGRGGSDHGR
jgi:hypothetical protein